MTVRLHKINGYTGDQSFGVGANSLALDATYFINEAQGGVVSKATVGGVISGVNDTIKTFASDNQTVALAKAYYVPTKVDAVYEVTITGGTITSADKGKYFDLSDAETVDGSTKSTTTGQVQMVEFISATKGIFKIVNA